MRSEMLDREQNENVAHLPCFYFGNKVHGKIMFLLFCVGPRQWLAMKSALLNHKFMFTRHQSHTGALFIKLPCFITIFR